MSIQKLNPGHKTLRDLEGKYIKLLGILIHKFKLGKVLITTADIEAFANEYGAELQTVVVDGQPEGLYVYLTSVTEALRLAQKENLR